jgi:hypothetical protein
MIREFILSCPVFGGYRSLQNVSSHDSLEGLVRRCIAELKLVLQQHHLDFLVDQLNAKRYHIHDRTIESLLVTDAPVYVCDCRICETPPSTITPTKTH